MPPRSYNQPGLVLRRGQGTRAQVKELQRDLRALGYLHSGIDGDFGGKTEQALRSLQYDLMNNDGRGRDGDAPVRIIDYNRSRVVVVDGALNQALAACISDMLDDSRYPKLPFSPNAAAENARIPETLAGIVQPKAPIPFIVAMFRQESNLTHYLVPGGNNEDNFVKVGLDRNREGVKDAITSRGFGVGQYTFFHYPLTEAQMRDYVVDVRRNIAHAIDELEYKFREFILGPSSGTTADDRVAEHGKTALRRCTFAEGDARYMKDCRACMQAAGTTDIVVDETPFFEGSKRKYAVTTYYKTKRYKGVPVRKNIPCDWPYAARRYNGSGVNSYHYQTIILRNILQD